jgi:Flp pilus assembly protein TadG
MALVMPVLFLLVFGIIEFGWTLSVQTNLVNAAREGARLGALPGTSAAEMKQAVKERLTPMGIQDKVSITATESTDSDPMVGVEVSVQRSKISLLGDFFAFQDGTLRAEAWMRKEGN